MCRKLCHLIWGIWWFHRSKDFEAMKAGKMAIPPWLSCQYNENTLVNLPSSVRFKKKCNCWRVFAIWPNWAKARACAYTAIGMIIQLLSDDRHSKWAVKRTQIGFTINLASARAQILKLLLLGQQTTQSLYFSKNLTNSSDSDLSLESKRYGIKECAKRGV